VLTLEDCLAMSELTPEEVAAIAMHEHVPQLVAAELGHCLLHRSGGVEQIRKMILDDIALARVRHDKQLTERLESILIQFIQNHN
jgi:hypothetical protein